MYGLCTASMPSTLEGQKRAFDPLELDLMMVVIHHIGPGFISRVLWKRSQCY